jgi:hypothetical protein
LTAIFFNFDPQQPDNIFFLEDDASAANALIINAFIGAVILLLILRLVGGGWGYGRRWGRRWR